MHGSPDSYVSESGESCSLAMMVALTTQESGDSDKYDAYSPKVRVTKLVTRRQ